MARTKDPALEKRRRNLIRATTYRLLARDSFHAVTLTAVAEAAGVSKGLVTYYYASKDALLLDTIDAYQGRYEALLAGLVAGSGSEEDRLRMLLQAAMWSQAAVADEARVQVEIWSFAKSRPEVSRWLQHRYRTFRETCARLLVGGGDSERANTTEQRRYSAIHALIDGLSFQIAADQGADMEVYRATAFAAIKALLAVEYDEQG